MLGKDRRIWEKGKEQKVKSAKKKWKGAMWDDRGSYSLDTVHGN